jgi:hypothetical protein
MSRCLDSYRALGFATCLIVFFAGLTACGGGANPAPPPSVIVAISVAISPQTIGLAQGVTQLFIPTVTGTSNTSVNWTVLEGAAGGTISASGIYTAPKAAGTFHVVATSTANPTKSATATVSVPEVKVFINPPTVDMGVGESFGFSGSASGTVNPAVSWTIQEGAAGGTITSTGVYTAPTTFGTFHVVATSQWDTSKTAIAPVMVEPVSVRTFPSTDVLGPAGVRTFTAMVTGTLNKAVTWTVLEGSAGGSITQTGDYTAPGVTGSFHLVATSVKDTTQSASSPVTIVPSGFRPTGSMRDGRTGHTATVLNTGKVLVAGGDACFFSSYYYGSCLLSSTELYDPAAGTFSSTGAMSARRSFHTATLLSDGRVLIAGGSGSSAELYDPTAGTFSATGSMSVGRNSHTATLLSNGNVLIVGGESVGGALSSAEEYDPAKASFAAKGNMATARSEHTATRLGNGKVLIVGGFGGTGTLASAELYDPTAGTFAATGSMAEKRSGHTASLLPNGNVLVAGGSNGQASLATAEIYDVASGKFTATSVMMAARDSQIAASLQNGTVLVTGGISGNPVDFTAEFYDPVTGLFVQTGSLGVGRIFAAAVLLPDERVLVTGGSDLNSAEIYK